MDPIVGMAKSPYTIEYNNIRLTGFFNRLHPQNHLLSALALLSRATTMGDALIIPTMKIQIE